MSEHDFDVSQVSNSTEYFSPCLKSILSIGLTIIKIEHFKITYWNIYVDKKLSKSFQNAKNIAQEPQNGKIINSNIVNVEGWDWIQVNILFWKVFVLQSMQQNDMNDPVFNL